MNEIPMAIPRSIVETIDTMDWNVSPKNPTAQKTPQPSDFKS